MGRDVIGQRYGRLFELPANLASLGHDVLGICLSYRPRPSGEFVHEIGDAELRWWSFNSGPGLVGGLPRFLLRSAQVLRQFDPDVLLSGSDAPHVILGEGLARRLARPYVVDLYDNFESFGLTRVPGLKLLYRRALRRAVAVSVVSSTLNEYLCSELSLTRVITLESTIDPSLFQPRDKAQARKRLGLPPTAKLVSVVGSLHPNRGVRLVYEAFEKASNTEHSLRLVLAGTIDSRLSLPGRENVHFLGKLPHTEMPWLYSASDLALLPMKDTEFGRYAFPQKAYEILACGTPIVAARVGAVERMLSQYPECLYEPSCAQSLADRIRHQLRQPTLVQVAIPSWRQQGRRLSEELADIVNPRRPDGDVQLQRDSGSKRRTVWRVKREE